MPTNGADETGEPTQAVNPPHRYVRTSIAKKKRHWLVGDAEPGALERRKPEHSPVTGKSQNVVTPFALFFHSLSIPLAAH
jgi:hypothetical protein